MMKVVPLVALAVLLLLGPPAANGAEKAPDSRVGDLQIALQDLRTVGAAMYSWYIDQLEPRIDVGPTESVREADLDLSAIALIGHEELERLLVPKYLGLVPAIDPWGQRYEYRLARDLDSPHAMAIRSAGQDRSFSGNLYRKSAFPLPETKSRSRWAS